MLENAIPIQNSASQLFQVDSGFTSFLCSPNTDTTFKRDYFMVTEKKRSISTVNALGVLAVIALFVLAVFVGIYIQQNITLQDKNNQITDLQSQLATPKLVSIGLQYADNRSDANAPFLHITGYVVNVGSTQANNCTIHVNAVQEGNKTAIDTTATINSLDAGKFEAIDIKFPYSGQALVAYTSYLTWSN